MLANEADPSMGGGTTLNLTVDGRSRLQLQSAGGRVNLLRAYDVSSNSFSLNQDEWPTGARCRPVGQAGNNSDSADLMYGQSD